MYLALLLGCPPDPAPAPMLEDTSVEDTAEPADTGDADSAATDTGDPDSATTDTGPRVDGPVFGPDDANGLIRGADRTDGGVCCSRQSWDVGGGLVMVGNADGGASVAPWPSGVVELPDVTVGTLPWLVGAAGHDWAVSTTAEVDDNDAPDNSALWTYQYTLSVYAAPFDRDQTAVDAVATLVSPWLSPADEVRPRVADLDGDGTDEVLLGFQDIQSYVWATPTTGLAGAEWSDLALLVDAPEILLLSGAGDVTGDGVAEIVTHSTSEEVYVFEGPVTPGSSSGDAAVTLTNALSRSTPPIGDVDCDGQADLLLLGAEAYLLTGPLTSGDPASLASATFLGEERALGYADAADVDADGCTDLVMSAGAVYLFLGGRLSGAISVTTADARYYGEDGISPTVGFSLHALDGAVAFTDAGARVGEVNPVGATWWFAVP